MKTSLYLKFNSIPDKGLAILCNFSTALWGKFPDKLSTSSYEQILLNETCLGKPHLIESNLFMGKSNI